MKKLFKKSTVLSFFVLTIGLLASCISSDDISTIRSVYLVPLDKNSLDFTIWHIVDFPHEKMLYYSKDDKLVTTSIQFSINRKIVLFNDTIPENINLWSNPKTKEHIKFTKICLHYSELVFDSTFYKNSLIDTVGLVVSFKVKGNNGKDFTTEYPLNSVEK